MTAGAVASSVENYDCELELYFISEQEYYDDVNEATVIEKHYSSVNPIINTFSVSGSGTFRNSKYVTFSDGTPDAEYWVSGYFSWNGETCSVSSVSFNSVYLDVNRNGSPTYS